MHTLTHLCTEHTNTPSVLYPGGVGGFCVRGSEKVEEQWQISVHMQVAFSLISSGPTRQPAYIMCAVSELSPHGLSETAPNQCILFDFSFLFYCGVTQKRLRDTKNAVLHILGGSCLLKLKYSKCF